MVFRRSITWHSDWLSTLRSAGYPRPTQDLLPAAGQTLPDGLSTPQDSDEKFQICFLHLILLSQAFLPQSHRPSSAIGPCFATEARQDISAQTPVNVLWPVTQFFILSHPAG
jgi:hypothetical protein